MQSDILFDNIYIGHSVDDATALKNATFDVKHKIEAAEEEASKPPAPSFDDEKSVLDLSFTEDPVRYVREKVDLFYTMARNDPIQAVKIMPEVAGGIGVVAVTILALLIGVVTIGTSSKVQPQLKKGVEKSTEKATEAKDAVVDAATTGADKLQSEVSKRATRSSGPAE